MSRVGHVVVAVSIKSHSGVTMFMLYPAKGLATVAARVDHNFIIIKCHRYIFRFQLSAASYTTSAAWRNSAIRLYYCTCFVLNFFS